MREEDNFALLMSQSSSSDSLKDITEIWDRYKAIKDSQRIF